MTRVLLNNDDDDNNNRCVTHIGQRIVVFKIFYISINKIEI